MLSKPTFLFVLGSLLVLFAFPFVGAGSLNFAELFEPGSPSFRILFELRLPRLVVVAVVGGSLAVLGGIYQSLFRNPIAEPYLLGTSSAVSLGIVLVHVFMGANPESLIAVGAGFLLAVSSAFLLIALCFARGGKQMDRVILFGMGTNFFLSSVLFLILSYHQQHMGGGSLRWLFGNIPWVGMRQALFLAAASIGFLSLVFLKARALDALSLGDTIARSLGVSPHTSRKVILLLSSAYLSLIVSVTGAIGFVGLVVPHGARLLFRPATSRVLFLQSLLLGASFLAFSDMVSRAVLPPFEFPIGVVTTLLGGPLFLYLLWKR